MPPRPAPAHRMPADLASARIALDTLLRDRLRAMLAPTSTPADGSPVDVADEVSDRAALLDALVREFVEQVDRHNDTAQRTAGDALPVLDYDDAVLVTGPAGVVVVSADTWAHEPIGVSVAVGEVERVIAGADVLAVLRDTDDAGPAAERLGLA